MITKVFPSDWKELQNKVGEILKECGFQVEIEKKILSVRGEIEIDVYAEENINERKYSILCECKYWKSNIPQTIIHAFRTVISDIGSNIGYIITTSDFQKGANLSGEKTNIELVSWDKFQMVFLKTWYEKHFSKEMHKIIKSDYDPLAIQFFDKYNLIEKSKFSSLIDKYNNLQDVINHFPHPIFKEMPEVYNNIENKLPLNEKISADVLEDWELCGCSLTKEILTEKYYDEFLVLIKDFAKPVYSELDKLDLYMDHND